MIARFSPFLASFLVLFINAEPGTSLLAADSPADTWSGTYSRYGGWDTQGPAQVVIAKVGDGYRLNLKGYNSFSFTEVVPGVLEAKSLGKIYRGSLRYENDPKVSIAVLRAVFCYEEFYLLGDPPRGPATKVSPK